MNLGKAVAGFSDHLRGNGYSRHTIRAYCCDLKGLERFCGESRLGLRDVRASHLVEFLNSRHTQLGPTGHTRAPGAINRVRASLRSFFAWLCDTGEISANPAAALRAKPPYPKLPEIMSKTVENRLLSSLRSAGDTLALRDRLMVEMLLAALAIR